MSQITAKPIWLPLLFESDQPAHTLLSANPLIQIGAECRLHISIFQSFGEKTQAAPGTVFNIQNFAAFILKIRTGAYGSSGTLKLDTSSGAAIAAGAVPDYNYNATAAQFWSRTAAQIELYLPSTVTANLTPGTLYGVFSGITNEAATQPDVFGKALFECEDVGIGAAGVAPDPAVEYVRSDFFQAALGSCVKYGWNLPGRFPIITSGDGAYGTALRTGNAPTYEFLAEQIPNT
jgi:hypothetical protein